MLNVGPGEMMLLAMVALILFGPGKMQEIFTAFGEAVRAFREASANFKDEVNRQLEAERLGEHEVHEETPGEWSESTEEESAEAGTAVEPKPIAAPTAVEGPRAGEAPPAHGDPVADQAAPAHNHTEPTPGPMVTEATPA